MNRHHIFTKPGIRFPKGFHLLTILAMALLAAVWIGSLQAQAQESGFSSRQVAVGSLAFVLFLIGYGCEVLAVGTFRRLLGAQIMAAAAFFLILGWSWDAGGMVIAATGWLIVTLMSLWGWKWFGQTGDIAESGKAEDHSP